MHFLLNHPDLRSDITETLKLRQHDSDESVRYEVVMAIVTTAKKDFEVVSKSEDLLDFVKERTLDKKVYSNYTVCSMENNFMLYFNQNGLKINIQKNIKYIYIYKLGLPILSSM